MTKTAWRIAVVGAGPVGLALALQAARHLPYAQITVFDARPADLDVVGDPRTLALSLGSVQFLQRLGAWPAAAATPILQVHVSQTPAGLGGVLGEPEVRFTAQDLRVPQLGAVLSYGALVAPLQAAWQQAVDHEPHRFHLRFGAQVAAIKPVPMGVEIEVASTHLSEHFDLAVVAEGGVFAQHAGEPALAPLGGQPLVADYGQTAWVGTVTLQGAQPGVAFERFTRDGPAALLPLPPHADGAARAALVWCVPAADDPVAPLSDAQRLAVLGTIFPAAAGRLVAITPLKYFALGLQAQRTLVQGRTVRIGNAAQILHPVAGQGLNLGLRDAHELVSVLRWADDIDTALQRAEWARAGDRWATIAATDFLARSFTWKLPGAATARGLGLTAVQALPLARNWLARRMMFGSR